MSRIFDVSCDACGYPAYGVSPVLFFFCYPACSYCDKKPLLRAPRPLQPLSGFNAGKRPSLRIVFASPEAHNTTPKHQCSGILPHEMRGEGGWVGEESTSSFDPTIVSRMKSPGWGTRRRRTAGSPPMQFPAPLDSGSSGPIIITRHGMRGTFGKSCSASLPLQGF